MTSDLIADIRGLREAYRELYRETIKATAEAAELVALKRVEHIRGALAPGPGRPLVKTCRPRKTR